MHSSHPSPASSHAPTVGSRGSSSRVLLLRCAKIIECQRNGKTAAFDLGLRSEHAAIHVVATSPGSVGREDHDKVDRRARPPSRPRPAAHHHQARHG